MNGNDFSSFLSGITSDPEMMNKIKAISEGLSGAGSDMPDVQPKSLLPEKPQSDKKAKNRAALIRALMPYLSEERRDKADMLLKIINLMDLKDLI